MRAAHQKLIVQNRRYLLLHKRETEANLASKALASALRALPDQWEVVFGYPKRATPEPTRQPTAFFPSQESQLRALFEALQTVPDPRSRARFRIGSVLGITAMAPLCGCRDVAAIHRFASRLTQAQRAKIGLPLKTRGEKFREIPGYQVFYCLLRDIDPKEMARVLTEWLSKHAATFPVHSPWTGNSFGIRSAC